MATRPGPGVSGVAVSLIGIGALLVWSAIHDVSPLDALRLLARGQVPTGKTAKNITPGYTPDPNFSVAPDGKSGSPGLPGGLRDYPDTYKGDQQTYPMSWKVV